MILSKDCFNAFKAAGVSPPAEVMRDRGTVYLHYDALMNKSAGELAKLGIPEERLGAMRDHAKSTVLSGAGGFTANYPNMPPTTVLFDSSFTGKGDFAFSEIVPHESVHRSGKGSVYKWYQYVLPFVGHDLSGLKGYDSIIANCATKK